MKKEKINHYLKKSAQILVELLCAGLLVILFKANTARATTGQALQYLHDRGWANSHHTNTIQFKQGRAYGLESVSETSKTLYLGEMIRQQGVYNNLNAPSGNSYQPNRFIEAYESLDDSF